jgi:hypothetical protein
MLGARNEQARDHTLARGAAFVLVRRFKPSDRHRTQVLWDPRLVGVRIRRSVRNKHALDHPTPSSTRRGRSGVIGGRWPSRVGTRLSQASSRASTAFATSGSSSTISPGLGSATNRARMGRNWRTTLRGASASTATMMLYCHNKSSPSKIDRRYGTTGSPICATNGARTCATGQL